MRHITIDRALLERSCDDLDNGIGYMEDALENMPGSESDPKRPQAALLRKEITSAKVTRDGIRLCLAATAEPEAPAQSNADAQGEPTQESLDAFIVRAGFDYGWRNLEGRARRMATQAVKELAAPTPDLRIAELTAQLADMTKERDKLAKDAARYQWLRDVGDSTYTAFANHPGYDAMQADRHIDAAIAATKGESK